MQIWLVSNFEQTPIDQAKSSRFQSIADYAIERKHEVCFFTSTFKHNTKTQRYSKTTIERITDNYCNVFVKSGSYKSNISIKRLIEHYLFSKKIIREFKKWKSPDVVLMTFPSISLAYEVSKWAKKRNIPYVVDIIDPWPDVFKGKLLWVPDFITSLIFRFMDMKVKFVINNASMVTAISNQYLAWAKKYQPNLKNTRCYYPARKLKEMQDTMRDYAQRIKRNDDVLRVIYAGSLSGSYDIPTILKAAKILNDRHGDKIQFVIAGAGPQAELIKKYLSELTNLKYLGRIPKTELLKEYYLSDVGLTQHVKGASQSVTYKLFDLLSCGLPILNSLESEMKNIILDNEVGFFNPPGDITELVKNIEKLFFDRDLLNRMKLNAVNFTAKAGDSERVYNEVVDNLEQLVSLR